MRADLRRETTRGLDGNPYNLKTLDRHFLEQARATLRNRDHAKLAKTLDEELAHREKLGLHRPQHNEKAFAPSAGKKKEPQG